MLNPLGTLHAARTASKSDSRAGAPAAGRYASALLARILSGYSGYDAFIIDSAFSRVRLTAKLGRIEYIHGTQ